jgi:hypothetical protein
MCNELKLDFFHTVLDSDLVSDEVYCRVHDCSETRFLCDEFDDYGSKFECFKTGFQTAVCGTKGVCKGFDEGLRECFEKFTVYVMSIINESDRFSLNCLN